MSDWLGTPHRFNAIQALSSLASVIALIVVVVLSVQTNTVLSAQQGRTCDVVNAKLNTDIALRATQDAAARRAVIASNDYIEATRRLLTPFKRSVRQGGRRSSLMRLIIPYLQANITVRTESNDASRASLNAAAEAIREWVRIKNLLQC